MRVTKAGNKAFGFRYEFEGRGRSISIGDYPTWSVSAAREQAAKYRRQVDAKEDPRAEADKQALDMSLSGVWEWYKVEFLTRKAPSTQKNETSIWKRLVLPKLGTKKVGHITRSDVSTLFREVSTKTPTQANRMLASILYAFRQAVLHGVIETNPAEGIPKNTEQARERYLSKAEWSDFAEGLAKRADTSTTLAIRFLILTGARRGEVMKAKWDEIDLEAKRWIKPPTKTKQRKRHSVPLSEEALRVLDRATALGGTEYIFPGKDGRPLYSLQKVFENICKEAGIRNFRLHDLRHNFASLAVSEGIPIEVLSKLLGHSNITTTQRYAHLYDDPLRAATERVGNRFSERQDRP